MNVDVPQSLGLGRLTMNVDVSSEPQSLDLSSGATVNGLQQPDRAAQDLSALCGYLGESDTGACLRLFTDPTLTSWVDIAEDAIRRRCRIPGEQDAYGGRSVVWVDHGTPLVRGEVTIADAEFDFLTGPWSSQMSWQFDDDGIGCAMAPKLIPWPSSKPSPSGIACC
jgi:hypothetical protein